MRVSIKLSFDDKESFKEAVESLRFNSSDPNTRQQMKSSNSVPLEDSDFWAKRNEDNISIPSDPIALLRVGSSSSLSIQEIGDVQGCFDNPPSNPEFIGTLATTTNGM